MRLGCKTTFCLAVLLVPDLVEHAAASSWDVEVSLGAGGGSRVRLGAPFEFVGLSFGGPYNACPLPNDVFCLLIGSDDVAYTRDDDVAVALLAGVAVRRRFGDSFSLGVGALGGGSWRLWRLSRVPLREVDHRRPPEPEELRYEAERGTYWRAAGIDWLLYLHGSVRFEHVFGQRQTLYDERPARVGIFAEAGAGALTGLPASTGTVAERRVRGVHGSLGARWHRRGSDLTLTITHLRPRTDADRFLSGRPSWTLVQLGCVLDD